MADSLLSSNNMQVNGGEFSIVQGNVIHNSGNIRIEDSRSETERIGRQKLFNNIYRNAFHNSSERSEEVNPEAVRKLVQKWTQKLRISLASAPTSPHSSFSSPASSSARPDNPDDVIRDVFTWLFDRWTPFLVMWIHGESVTQSALIAQAIAGILQGLGKLSGSFFCSNADDGKGVVDVTRVIPTLAYQLMQNVQSTRFPIAQVVLQDESIFDLELQVQIERLLLDPLTTASSSSTSDAAAAAPGIPNVFLIHNLERLNNKHHFHASFLHEFADALPAMESHNSLHRLLIIGQHTSHLRQCVSTSAMRQIVLQRPMSTRLWLGNVQELNRKEEAIRRKEDALRRKEEELVSIRQQITQMAVSVVTQQVNEEIKTMINKCVETLTMSMTSRIPILQETIDEQITEIRDTMTDDQVDGADDFSDENKDYVPESPDIKDAKWIWTKEVEKGNPPLPVARPFRRVIKTDSVVDRLMIDITCDNRYTLYVNGRLVGCGADWMTPDRYGVEFQRTKKVVIAVYASEDEGSSPVGLIVSGKVWYSQTRDGKETAFISDGSWKTLSEDGFDRNFIWSDFKDNQWEDPYVIGCYGRFPWFLESMKPTQPGKLVHQRWTDVKFLRGNVPDAPEAPRAKLIS